MLVLSERVRLLERNVFADMDRAKTEAINQGKKIIDLSLGSADLSTAKPIIEAIEKSLYNPENHRYLLHGGTAEFRKVVADWYQKRFGNYVDWETEVLPLIGSQEGSAHFPLAVINPGDYALTLDPGYPSHAGGVYLASGQVYAMPLLEENNFLPQFADIPEAVLSKAKLMILSYPHNPTTAIAPRSFFEEAFVFCKKHNLILVHDFPYMDIYFGEERPISVLEVDKNKEISIEFFTFSKSYNMGGFRIGFAIGNSQLITALRKIKSIVDFNQYRGILQGAITALTSPQECVAETVRIYRERRDFLVSQLAKIGWQVPLPPATLYVWAKLPSPWQQNSIRYCVELLKETGVALSPGAGFGKYGEGYVRFALVQPPEILAEAVAKIALFHQKTC
ncbi:MAG: LL-diaminopimelate aminotransferase [Geminocystis sp.]|nr:LL-diaminopimelate aminotransferase [Geminocystis sp.]HIK37216.1 LL-diaminopimelate aminotransferase [Geminocystis sp. M7585_C2015_104]MCS7147131.1 LL-diaminopimelate aminotransferase [Geminocystis sp.]MCX8079120.1 LL-diaminopimelate aminotransferase [Geminocystis sp.]MDW8116767.1 LL-diaminopimelate aminotransferase [Geminocystis sp.]